MDSDFWIFVWVLTWIAISLTIKYLFKTKSATITIGGGFIASLILISAMASFLNPGNGSSEDAYSVIGPGLLLAFLFLFVYLSQLKGRVILRMLSSHSDFTVTQQLIGRLGTALAVDEGRKKVCLVTASVFGTNAKARVLDYRDLVASEIHEDGATITRTSRSSQVGGVVVGGLLLGGVGAIVGGLSGKTISTAKVHRIDLRLIVNDTNSPIHEINLMESPANKNDLKYKVAMQDARHWHGLLEVLIRQADIVGRTPERAATRASSSSIADEVRKLHELKVAGALTEVEFQSQKAALLNSSTS